MATIDEARTSPPPSVLAPINLADPAEVAAVMNIAARIGEILIANATTSADAAKQIHTVCSSYGLHYVHVSITVNTITLNTIIGVDQRTPVNVFRVVTMISENYHKLQEVDRLIRSIRSGATPPEMAERILNDIDTSPIPHRNARNLAPLLGEVPRIESAHPSPLSARNGFFGSRPFSRADELLRQQGGEPIDWRLP